MSGYIQAVLFDVGGPIYDDRVYAKASEKQRVS